MLALSLLALIAQGLIIIDCDARDCWNTNQNFAGLASITKRCWRSLAYTLNLDLETLREIP